MKYFIGSIFAGMMIAFGGVVNVCCAMQGGGEMGRYMGAFLFSLGLLTVVARGYDLYTGKIGYISFSTKPKNDAPTNVLKHFFYFPTIILGNFVGAGIVGLAFRATSSFGKIAAAVVPQGVAESLGYKAGDAANMLDIMCIGKLSATAESAFLLSCACGVMMFLAVDGYKKTKSWLFVILPVMVFILSGFEHCVANMFYFWAADCWSATTFKYLLIMIVGNGVGAVVFSSFKSGGKAR